jgi:RNA polymerase sigma-B factor
LSREELELGGALRDFLKDEPVVKQTETASRSNVDQASKRRQGGEEPPEARRSAGVDAPQIDQFDNESKPALTQRDGIVRKFMPLVRQIARRYSQYNPDSMEDLVQVGSIGLLKAIKYYDPNRERSASFKTLATCYIRGEIRHYLRDHSSLVQVPRKLTEMNAQLAALEERLTRQFDRAPTLQELAQSSGHSVQDILEAQLSWDVRLNYESFDFNSEEEENNDRRALSELVADKRGLELMYASEERELVAQALKQLGARTREIVEFVFFYDLSQKETATVLGLSEMGVSRAVHSALKKLRDIFKSEELKIKA